MFKVNNKKTRMTSMPKWDFNEVAKQLLFELFDSLHVTSLLNLEKSFTAV